MTGLKSKETVSREVAYAVIDQVSRKPSSLFGLPTGRTPKSLYGYIKEITEKERIDWSRARFFGLDEYLNTSPEKTFQFYLKKNIYTPLKVGAEQCFNPLYLDNYDEVIDSLGGLDLTILGIGANGHIAFNEPPTPELSWTHCIWLSDSTREANQEFFESSASVPKRAVTMGIQTLLSSRKIILMAFGKNKKAILTKSLTGPVDSSIPASFLQLHRNLEVYTDFEFTV